MSVRTPKVSVTTSERVRHRRANLQLDRNHEPVVAEAVREFDQEHLRQVGRPGGDPSVVHPRIFKFPKPRSGRATKIDRRGDDGGRRLHDGVVVRRAHRDFGVDAEILPGTGGTARRMDCGAKLSGGLNWKATPVVSFAFGMISTHSSMSSPANDCCGSTAPEACITSDSRPPAISSRRRPRDFSVCVPEAVCSDRSEHPLIALEGSCKQRV